MTAYNPVLDPDRLASIAEDARHCFVYEEAPECLLALEQGIAQIREQEGNSHNPSAEYAETIRAAHSLKGGAGMAGLLEVSHLAHKLEELLIALQQGRVGNLSAAHELLSLSADLISDLILNALNNQEPSPTARQRLDNFIQSLERFVEDLPAPRPEESEGTQARQQNLGSESDACGEPLNPFVKTALEVDLEDCLQRLERSLHLYNDNKIPQDAPLRKSFTLFLEECQLLGQTLNLNRLNQRAREFAARVTTKNTSVEEVAQQAIAEIRQLKTELLTPKPKPTPATAPGSQKSEATTPDSKPRSAAIPERFLKYIILNPQAAGNPANLNLRVPAWRVNRMSNTVGELLIKSERLAFYQQQLDRASQSLENRIEQLMAIAPNGDRANTRDSFPELTVRVAETRTDVKLISREFNALLGQLHASLEQLNQDLTDSRLVPFGEIAQRFAAPLQTLQQQYHKQVELVVRGNDTLVDRAILEQLQTPLTHLFRNAFDHGIELPVERKVQGKSEVAKIILSATVEGSQLTIAIADNGRGIDPQKVYDRALERNLISSDTPEFSQLSTGEIFQFLFAPGFSTATKVTDLSGRGVGLDIVQHACARLRGTLEVESEVGGGTKFTLRIPLTPSRVSAYLCQCQQRILAVETQQVRACISLSPTQVSAGKVEWEKHALPLFSLSGLLPYGRYNRDDAEGNVVPREALVVEGKHRTVAIAVDAILEQRQVVLKPLEMTVSAPPYVAGCTVLGSGAVVPILALQHLEEILPPEETPAPIAQVPARAQVLVVDDSIAVRRSLEKLLSQAGFAVVLCRDGREALAQLQRSHSRFDLVLSDLEMPNLDGFGLLECIRDRPQWREIAIAMLTSRATPQHLHRARCLGATAYLTKPFQGDRLVQAIAAILARGDSNSPPLPIPGDRLQVA
ncbi:hybrid sensor histidine kinase/response regulator [Phormidium sp. CCY1219]|uniref:hybrid sensor histidine kinase/response regulator n=1 Tax=Phormidium sp. CCY1219 TaxID=2886104 RepID=UPI002D1E7E43|nr:hybrid sensor histidine kinase/response regulator [Phormidium sp. CCY1219]MEB3830225.1 hybrid sensor histidine kinase/response regulator [Phormidium sp. CCY1219]